MDRLGYDVLHLKLDGDLHQARIADRASGGIVEAHFDSASGELVRAELAR